MKEILTETECHCGHDHGHEHHHHDHAHASQEEKVIVSRHPQTIYILENLGCANCAAKMEKKINQLPEVDAATITYATKQLRVAAKSQEGLLEKFQEICSSIEGEVIVRPQVKEKKKVEKKEKESVFKKNELALWHIGLGAVMFIFAGVIGLVEGDTIARSGMYLIAYVLLGWKIVLTAGKNLLKGHLFDENFLMSVATLAAFGIGDFAEAVGVMLFYRVGEMFEDIAVAKSRSQIMDAIDLRPDLVHVVEGNQTVERAPEDVKVGEVILVRPGDRIALDGIVIEGESRLDTSAITGEPVPVRVEKKSHVLSGCVNVDGLLKIRVEKPLEESMVTRILDSVENAAASKPKMDRFITRFAAVYTPVVVAAALLTAIVPSLMTGDWKHWIYTAITFLVISCPCALVLSVPLAFFSGIGAGSKLGILFKGGVSIEALKNVKAVVMDKTGTITKGVFAVQKIYTAEGWSEEDVLKTAGMCEGNSTHPIAGSILEEVRNRNWKLQTPQDIHEYSGKGVKAIWEDSTYLCGNYPFLKEQLVENVPTEMPEGTTLVYIAKNREYMGCISIADEIKEDAKETIREMKKQKLVTVMVTGDAKASGEKIGKEVEIDRVYGECLPHEKLEKMQQIRTEVGPVLFVGDGINDAPVLAGADVGAAMGSGADAAIEAADVVFMTSKMEALTQAIRIAKKTGTIAMENVIGALGIKAIVIILGFLGFANMWMAVFADTGVAMICVLNSIRILYQKK